MVAGVSVQEGQELTPGGRVDDLVDPREGERILGTGLIEAGVVDTHAPGLVLLQDEDWVGQPLGVKHFHDEAGRQELGDLFTDGPSLFFRKALQGLTDRLGVLADVVFVLGVLPRDTRHVLGGPCKNISILIEEVVELAFLFAVEAGVEAYLSRCGFGD